MTAEVTAMIQEAELHGDVMTVAEAVWRHEMLLEEEHGNSGRDVLVVMLLPPRESSID